MAQHVFWKGWLKLSLVTCRVALTPATSDREKVRFHTLNRATGNRVAARYVDEATGKPVREGDVGRGYPSGEDSHVLIEDEELESIALESARTIDIESFVPRDAVGWLYLDTPHYVVPDDEVGAEAFAVIRDAMVQAGTAALSRLVLYRRERSVMLEPCGAGFLLWTLRFGDEVRRFEGAPQAGGAPDKAALALLGKLIDAETRPWSADLVHDTAQEDLAALIDTKTREAAAKGAGKRGTKGGAKRAAPRPEGDVEPPAGKVVNIMDALRSSLKRAGKAPGG